MTTETQGLAKASYRPTPGQIAMRTFYGRGDRKYGVYPGGWDRKRYGIPPMLGIVYADDEFLAKKQAYDRGLWLVQSIEPRVRQLSKAPSDTQP